MHYAHLDIRARRKCGAEISVSDILLVGTLLLEHCKFSKHSWTTHRDMDGLRYELIPSNKKKNLLLLERHTFAQMGYDRLWYCSKKTKLGCRAQVRMDARGAVVYYRSDHNHDPPRLHKTIDGRYVKL
ncbi:hypothetical protein EVAR_42963_1 [Eumeta japonica]|uniref:FLYWCH-type domain-containing protein n=1 Tax=Eumeta variegata TaxID=151549 RepID=A0A4C1YBS1_EUMVA|nr:hypothetical protein EVAR_42963_1 [Eumeta japonica]